MQFKLPVFILIIQGLQSSAWSQVTITSLEMGSGRQWLSYSFPLIHSSNKSDAQKINY
jgi:hypothetical protein